MRRLANRVTRLEAAGNLLPYKESPLKSWLEWMSLRERRRLLAILRSYSEQGRIVEGRRAYTFTEADRHTSQQIFLRAKARKQANWRPPKGTEYRNGHRWQDCWSLESQMRYLEPGAPRAILPEMDDLDWLDDKELDRLEAIVKGLDRTTPWNAAALSEIEAIKTSGQARCRMGEWPLRAWEAIPTRGLAPVPGTVGMA